MTLHPREVPKALTLTTGEFLFTDRMSFVAEMRPEYVALAPVIVRRYNAHEQLKATAAFLRDLILVNDLAPTPADDAWAQWDAALALLAEEV